MLINNNLKSKNITPNAAALHSVKIAQDGVKRTGIELLSQKEVTVSSLRKIWDNIPQFEHYIDEQIEIDAHYQGYLKKQNHDIEAFKKDEGINIPNDIDYDLFSGLSIEIKSKLKLIQPKTLGQALRIDGVTPAAVVILLGFIKKSRYKVSA